MSAVRATHIYSKWTEVKIISVSLCEEQSLVVSTADQQFAITLRLKTNKIPSIQSIHFGNLSKQTQCGNLADNILVFQFQLSLITSLSS